MGLVQQVVIKMPRRGSLLKRLEGGKDEEHARQREFAVDMLAVTDQETTIAIVEVDCYEDTGIIRGRSIMRVGFKVTPQRHP